MSPIRPLTDELGQLVDNDDDTTAEVDLGFSFYGYTSCWVGNNGGITFQRPFDTNGLNLPNPINPFATITFDNFTPIKVWQFGHAVYPVWMDWDTRPFEGADFGLVRYGMVGSCFSVIWEGVGLYSTLDLLVNGDTRRSTFQLIINSTGGIEFNYETIQHDMGKVSYSPYGLAGDYDSPTATLLDWPNDYLHFPIVGYSLPVGDLVFDRPDPVLVTTPRVPQDPDINDLYLLQGLSGFTDGGANSLAGGTNTGVTGRWRFLWSGGDCGRTPPLRQNQRDDIRQGQRTSRQLTVRQVGYL